MTEEAKKTIGAVLVVGAGITGMQSALDLANSGYKVYLVEKNPSIGGRMSQLDKTFPTNDCAMCMISPKLVEVAKNNNIELITNADVESVEGEEGNFKVKLFKEARYIDLLKCTSCGDCATACPVELRNEFEQGLNNRKAAYKRYPQAIPGAYAISKAARPPCKLACPSGCNAQGYIALTSKGKYVEALNLIKQTIPLPAVVGRICHHPCEQNCNRAQIDSALGIAPIKSHIADVVRKKRKEGSIPVEEKPKIDKSKPKIAIVGSGPSGLSCAYDLVKHGYPVTIFEAAPEPGGALRYAIPAYRLPREVLAADIKDIIDLGIELKLNTPINDKLSLSSLKTQGYKAIYLAIGTQKSKSQPIPGAETPGVLQALEFLRDVSSGKAIKPGKRAVIIGGGNVAVDSARTCVRLGFQEVNIVYRRTKAEMPALHWEIEEAEEEGVKILNSWGPKEIIAKDGKVAAMDFQKYLPAKEGDRSSAPAFDTSVTKRIECDTVILAIGQTTDLSFLPKDTKIKTSKDGLIAADPVSLATDEQGIFAGGDGVTGPKSAVEAIAQGHEAAISIERFLSGLDLKRDRQKAKEEGAPTPEGKHAKMKRVAQRTIPMEKRISTFEEANISYSEEEAKAEADRCLNCGICSECMQCVAVCGAKAIDHSQKDQRIDIAVGSVVLAPGFDPINAQIKGEYGYGRMPNVVTSIEFERILSASGAFQGVVKRPSDGKHPVKVAWIQCVGSRDKACGRDYCSSVCCMYASKEAIIAREHDKNIQPTIFYNDLRAFGKGFDRYYESAKDKFGVRYVNSIPSTVKELQKSHNLVLGYTGEDGKKVEEEFDMVVLSVGMVPSAASQALAKKFGIKLDNFGFCSADEMRPNVTSRPGVFVAGAFSAPMDIPESVVSASGAACLAGQSIFSARGTLVTEKTYPAEKDTSAEPPRVGVFVCRCGTNIARVVNVPAVVEYAKTLPYVVHAEENIYTCSTDSQEKLIKAVREKGLNRVVVASCSPRTHEALFQDCIREGGLNKYLFEMANIRDQCSWVHASWMPESTEKAKDLVKMAVGRSVTLLPLHQTRAQITKRALVIGGGLTGLVAAQSLAAQGFEAAIVEREKELGGNLKRIYFTESGANPQEMVKTLIKQVESDDRIKVYKGAELKNISGYLGNYVTEIKTDKGTEKIEHGVVIVATGGTEYKPTEYLYGTSPNIVTQLELEKKIADGEAAVKNAKSIAMIQCVGSREGANMYCSRVCCGQAIKNAIKLKTANPDVEISILYRDIRSYGMHELEYRKAREMGVQFIRYDVSKKPVVTQDNGKLTVTVMDKVLNRDVELKPDLLVLSAAIRPQADASDFASTLKLPLTQEKFFMEAHMKLRPLDFVNEGMYLCGLAHSPKTIGESITQARGAVSRAITVLSQPSLLVGGVVSVVDPDQCVGCLTCVRSCPFNVPRVTEEGVAFIEAAACQGCGICAGACPRKAIKLSHYSDEQVIAKLDALAQPAGERS